MEKPLQNQQEKGNEKIATAASIPIDHMEMIIVQEWIINQLEQRSHKDYLCFMHLNEVKDSLSGEQYNDAIRLIEDRIDCNDKLMRVISGDKDTLKELFNL